MATSIGGGNGREGSAKLAVADQISQSVQSTANILHLMRQSSPVQAQLMKLPKNLVAKTSTIKNTELALQHMPRVISSLDEHVENGLRSVPHLDTVVQLLSNMRNVQFQSLSTLLEGGRRRISKSRLVGKFTAGAFLTGRGPSINRAGVAALIR